MNDLMQDESLGQVLRHFRQANRPTALLCHGPIATLAARRKARAYRPALLVSDAKPAKAASQDR